MRSNKNRNRNARSNRTTFRTPPNGSRRSTIRKMDRAKELRAAGLTFEAIGRRLNLSTERARQLFNGFNLSNGIKFRIQQTSK